MSNIVQREPNALAPDSDNPQSQAISQAIRQLLLALSSGERAGLLRELARENSVESPRAGGVLATVIRLIPKDQRFTAGDIRRAVDASGIEASAKQVFNALGYLAKTGRIQRVGHGRYIVDGALLLTQDDLGEAPTRHEIDDT